METPAPPHWTRDALAGTPTAAWYLADTVSFRGLRLGASGIGSLLDAGVLDHVTHLDLGDTQIGQEGLKRLCGEQAPHNLHSLRLSNSRRSSAEFRDLEPLFGAPFFRRLRELDVANHRLTAGCARALGAQKPRLRRLDLSGNCLEEGGVRALCQALQGTGIEILALSGTQAGDAGVSAALASGPRRLRLNQNGASVLGVRGPEVSIESLSVGSNPLGTQGLTALMERLAQTRTLRIWACGLNASSMRVLAEHPLLSGLELLELGWNRLGGQALAALGRGPRPTALRTLSLRSTKADDDGVEALVAGGNFSQLERLSLRRCRITDRTVRRIADGGFPRLTELNLEMNALAEPGLRAARALEQRGVRVLL